MKNKNLLGGILAIIAALLGIIGHPVIFLNWYQVGMHTPNAQPGCEIMLRYMHPLMTDFGILGGVLFAVSAFGYFRQKKWAFPMTAFAIILALLASWFINVPYMEAHLPPVYMLLFVPYLILYFLFMISVGNLSWSRTLLAMCTGLAYILCFMNGVASTARMAIVGAPVYTMVERLSWVAMIGWGVVTGGILLAPREWNQVLGITAAVLELVVGIPLGIADSQLLGHFSLFAAAPIFCLALLVVLVWPGLWQRWTGVQS